jgi:hypothetical protein
MIFDVKKTTELTSDEIKQICLLFNEIFVGHFKNEQNFKNEYLNTILGYSLHSIIIDNNSIVGFHSIIPTTYIINKERILGGYTADTMIKFEYRKFSNILNLINICDKEALKLGIDFTFTLPNKNSYGIFIKGLKYIDNCNLNTYILPVKMSSSFTKLKFLNFLFKFSSRIFIFLGSFQNNKKIYSFLIDKERSEFYTYRLKWNDENYNIIEINDCKFVYRIITFKGIITAFLIDIDNISKYNINHIIKYIYEKEKKHIELILYVGNLPFHPYSLIKIPHLIEPKKFHFVVKNINNKMNHSLLFDMKNWNINLSCTDLV